MLDLQPTHPDAEILTAFGLGKLDPHTHDEVERHVAGCDTCCQSLRTVPDDTLLWRMRSDVTCAYDNIKKSGPGGASPDGVTKSGPGAADRPTQTMELAPELADHPRYRIVKLLGAGGMGMVFQAEHRLMARQVALKVISRQYTDNPLAVERFRQEVKAAARLSHPNIVTAHDAEQAGNLHFLVMEFVEGVSLARWVEKRGALSVTAAANYAWQAARGLQHAHEHGMVHRDIKPHNLMLTPKGRVKILDFGLARLARESGKLTALQNGASQHAGSGAGSELTMAGAVLGTPDYIAPEQACDSRQVDIRADIYSLGCTLYFLLAGHPPFPKGSAVEKLTSHIERRPPDLAGLRGDLPPELAAIVERMMAKNPEHRFATPADAASALERFSKPPAANAENQVAVGSPPAGLAGLDAMENALAAETAMGRPGSTTTPDPLFSGALDPLHAVGTAALAPHWPPAARGAGPAPAWKKWLRRNRRLLGFAGAVAAGLLVLAACLPPALRAVKTVLAKTPEKAAADTNGASNAVAGEPSRDQPSTFAAADTGSNNAAAAAGISVLLLVPSRGVWYADYEPIERVLRSSGVALTVASTSRGEVPFQKQGGQPRASGVYATASLDEVDPANYQAVIVCGGDVWEFVHDTPAGGRARGLIVQMQRSGKLVGGLCIGSIVLAKAGVLENVPVARNQFLEKAASQGTIAQLNLVDQPVVVAGRLVTGGADRDAEAFAHKVVELLK